MIPDRNDAITLFGHVTWQTAGYAFALVCFSLGLIRKIR